MVIKISQKEKWFAVSSVVKIQPLYIVIRKTKFWFRCLNVLWKAWKCWLELDLSCLTWLDCKLKAAWPRNWVRLSKASNQVTCKSVRYMYLILLDAAWQCLTVFSLLEVTWLIFHQVAHQASPVELCGLNSLKVLEIISSCIKSFNLFSIKN